MLNAYYFRQHMYTLVPRYVREDMAWLADVGTDAISIAVLEQDLYASIYNIDIICNEADKRGMTVHAVPSRWGGVIAGSPKVPSTFTTQHPETQVLHEDGSPFDTEVSGRISSIHHPATLTFFCEKLTELLEKFPIKGIVWDEPKVLHPDHSEAAKQAMNGHVTWDGHLQGVARFFQQCNAHIKSIQPDILTSLFAYAHVDQDVIDVLAQISNNDYFGCDGRPWRTDDGGHGDSGQEIIQKALLGPGERFIEAARTHGRQTMMLIENHAVRSVDCELLDRRLPEVLKLDVDQWFYYYYGRNCDDPDLVMDIMRKHLKNR